MKKHLPARILRAAGRLLLLAGAIFDLGLIALFVYGLIYRSQHPDVSYAALAEKTNLAIEPSAIGQLHPILAVAVTIFLILIALGIILLIASIYNRHMRNIVSRIAKFLHITIFSTELLLTLITWVIATIILLFIFPVASVVTFFCLAINELLFIFAWGAYGQPKYKI